MFLRVRLLALLVVPIPWLEKLRLVADRVTGAVPLPVNCAVCGELEALSWTVSVPARLPKTVGVKVTEMLQLPFAANVPGDSGQFEVCAKSPEVEMLAMVNGTLRLFCNVTTLAALIASTG